MEPEELERAVEAVLFAAGGAGGIEAPEPGPGL